MRELTYYVAVTLDGFIGAPDGSWDFFPVEGPWLEPLVAEYPETIPTHVRRHLGIDAPARHFDTVLMGRTTWEPALEVGLTSAYQHLDQHVFSRTLTPPDDPTLTVVADDPVAHVRDLKQRPGPQGLGIWLAGGGRLAGTLVDEIDRLVLKRHPVLAGEGIPLAAAGFAARRFEVESETHLGPLAVSTYRRTRSD